MDPGFHLGWRTWRRINIHAGFGLFLLTANIATQGLGVDRREVVFFARFAKFADM